MVLFGFCFAGPAYTYWYRFLDRHVVVWMRRGLARHTAARNVSQIGLAWRVAAVKVALDDLVFEPVYLPTFFAATTLLAGQPPRAAVEQIRAEFWSTYIIDLVLWTPIQLINFRWIPVLYQPVLVNGVNIGWNAFLSYVSHRSDSQLPSHPQSETHPHPQQELQKDHS
ncbi:hypothetical protein SeLEV6574_g04728 [Synchytrium endobioticum]|nr:hypothetical protein SeLEV6574_g04728 [Synchytrium endobioticum]